MALSEMPSSPVFASPCLEPTVLIYDRLCIAINLRRRTEYTQLLGTYAFDFEHRSFSVHFGGHFPIHRAACMRNIVLLRLLIDGGANVDVRTRRREKQTALALAVQADWCEGVKLLIDHGALDNHHMPRHTTFYGVCNIPTLLDYACEHNFVGMAALLLEHQCNWTCIAVADSTNSLLKAVTNGHAELVRVLVTAGANVRARTRAWTGHESKSVFDIAWEKRDTDMLGILMNADCEIDCMWFGLSMLERIMWHGDQPAAKVVRLMLDHGVRIPTRVEKKYGVGEEVRLVGQLARVCGSDSESDDGDIDVPYIYDYGSGREATRHNLARLEMVYCVADVLQIRRASPWRPQTHSAFQLVLQQAVRTLLLLARAQTVSTSADTDKTIVRAHYPGAWLCELPNELLQYLFDFVVQAPFDYDALLARHAALHVDYRAAK